MPATSPWMRRGRAPRRMARRAAGLHHLRGGPVVPRGLVRLWQRAETQPREFLERPGMREELQQRGGVQAHHGRGLCDGRAADVVQGLHHPVGQEDAVPPHLPAVRGRGRDGQRPGAGNRRASGGHSEVAVPLQEPGQPLCGRGGVRPLRPTGELHRRPQQRLHLLVAVRFRADSRDGAGQPDDALHLSRIRRHRRRRACGGGPESLSDAGLYWNATCLRAIGAPQFWPKGTLEPIIDEWRASLPPPGPPAQLPICR